MQWLIDLIKEWVQAQNYATQAWVEAKGYLTTGFVRRVTVVGWDLTLAQLTADSAWHTLDFGYVVPTGAKAILFNQTGTNSGINKTFFLRYPNDLQWNMTPGLNTQVANIATHRCNVVACNTDREIEYRLTTDGWTTANLQILGWWL